MKRATALVYSSHDRCNYIHNDWIVQRALDGNKQLLYLPMSEGVSAGDEYRRQEYSWSKFAWFFNHYKKYGLDASPFYWNSKLKINDVEKLFTHLAGDEVVILGGGNPRVGYSRFVELGRQFYDDPDMFNRILHQRQAEGLLTAGYSAGADQLCQVMASSVDEQNPVQGFAVCRNIMVLTHFNQGQESVLENLASQFKHSMVFGLPNDSGLAVSQGILPSGKIWQTIELITDSSWDYIEDQHHIKTWQGMLIQHYYPDGRHWAYSGGDIIVRITSADESFNQTFVVYPNGSSNDYRTQKPGKYRSVEEILKDH